MAGELQVLPPSLFIASLDPRGEGGGGSFWVCGFKVLGFRDFRIKIFTIDASNFDVRV